MNRKPLLILFCVLLGACAPQNQMSILNSNVADVVQTAKKSCDSLSRKPILPYITCLCDAETDLLEKAGFEYTDLSEDRCYGILDVARKYDAGIITKDEAESLRVKIEKQFNYNVQRADAAALQEHQEKMRKIAIGLSALGAGMSSLSNSQQASSNAYSSVATAPVYDAQANANYWQNQGQINQQNMQSLQNTQNYQSSSSSGIGQGATGWDGRNYVPVNPSLNPGLTPNGYAQ